MGLNGVKYSKYTETQIYIYIYIRERRKPIENEAIDIVLMIWGKREGGGLSLSEFLHLFTMIEFVKGVFGCSVFGL